MERDTKTLKFVDFKALWILDGIKTSTMRLFDDKDLTVGDNLELVNSNGGEVFSEATISEIIYKTLGKVNNIDLDGHEKWNNREEMLQSLKKYYGDAVDWDTEVKIVRFTLN